MNIGAIIPNVAPLPLSQVVVSKHWGTNAPSKFNVASQLDGVHWAEMWIASEDAGRLTRVSSGSQSGLTLAQLKAMWGSVLTGTEEEAPDVKQTPTLTCCFRIERTGPKPGPIRVQTEDEFWYVLEAGPEAWIGAGTIHDEGIWRTRLKIKTMEIGDRYLIPKGLIHCQGIAATILKVRPIGAIVETLNNWGRPLTLDSPPPPQPIPVNNRELPELTTICKGRDRILYQGPKFTATLVNTNFASATGDKMLLICPVRGRGSIETSGVLETIRLNPGQAVIIPAGIGPYSIKSTTLISYLIFDFNLTYSV